MDIPQTENHDSGAAAEAASPPLADGRRLHGLTLVQRVLRSLPALVFVLLPFLGGSSGSDNWITLVFLALYATVALPLIIAQYLRFQYWITPREVIIHSGVFTRRKRNIPLDRIQNITIERSLLPRLMGSAKVKIETAGSKSAEGVLEYVSLKEAQRIRHVVRTYQQQGTAERLATADDQEDETVLSPLDAPLAPPLETPAEPLFTMALPRILLSGAFRFSLIYIALIFSGLQYVMDALNLTPEELANWLVQGGLDPYTEAAKGSPWLLGIATVFAAMLLGWATGSG